MKKILLSLLLLTASISGQVIEESIKPLLGVGEITNDSYEASTTELDSVLVFGARRNPLMDSLTYTSSLLAYPNEEQLADSNRFKTTSNGWILTGDGDTTITPSDSTMTFYDSLASLELPIILNQKQFYDFTIDWKEGEEAVINEDFSTDVGGFVTSIYGGGSATLTHDTDQAKLNVTSAGTNTQFKKSPLFSGEDINGSRFCLEYEVKSDGLGINNVSIGKNSSPWTTMVIESSYEPTTEFVKHKAYFNATITDVASYVLMWVVKNETGNIYFDNVKLYRVDESQSVESASPILTYGNRTYTLDTSWQDTTLSIEGVGDADDYYTFDGVDDYITIADDNSLEIGTNDFTYYSEFTSGALDVTSALYIKGGIGASYKTFIVYLHSVDILQVYLGDGSGAYAVNGIYTSIEPYTRYKIGVVIDRNDSVKVYLDGSLATGIAFNNSVDIENASNSLIGFNGGTFLNLTVYNTKLFNKALTQSQIQNIDTVSGAVLDLNGDSTHVTNSTWYDASGNDNDGTVSGATAEYFPRISLSLSDTAKVDFKISVKKDYDKKRINYGDSIYVWYYKDISVVGDFTETLTMNYHNKTTDANINYDVTTPSDVIYYVSGDGDDSNDGLTELTPWKTISKVNSYDAGTGFNAGDIIKFDIATSYYTPFNGTVNITSDGTVENPIIISAYNSDSENISYQYATFANQDTVQDFELYSEGSVEALDTIDSDLTNSTTGVITGTGYAVYRLQFNDGTLNKYFIKGFTSGSVTSQAALYQKDGSTKTFNLVANSESEVLATMTTDTLVYNLQTPISVDSSVYYVVQVVKGYVSHNYQRGESGGSDSSVFVLDYTDMDVGDRWTSASENSWLSSFNYTSGQIRTTYAVGVELDTGGVSADGSIFKTYLTGVGALINNSTFSTEVDLVDLDAITEYTYSNDTVYLYEDTTNVFSTKDTGFDLDGDYLTINSIYIDKTDSGVVLNGRGINVDSVWFNLNNLGVVSNDYNTVKRSTFNNTISNIANDSTDFFSNWFLDTGLLDSSAILFTAGESDVIHNSFFSDQSGYALLKSGTFIDTLVNNAFSSTTTDYLVDIEDAPSLASNNAFTNSLDAKFDNAAESIGSFAGLIADANYISSSDLGYVSTNALTPLGSSILVNAGITSKIDYDHDGNTIPLETTSPDVGASEYQSTGSSSSGEADYYFATSGSDLTGDGSESNPYQSLSKLQILINNTSGKVFALNRGDEWNGSLEITAGGVLGDTTVVTAYGTGDLPIISRVDEITDTWTQSGNIYSLDINSYLIGVDRTTVGIRRIWVDGTELTHANFYADLGPSNELFFHRTNGIIYVYSTTDLNSKTVEYSGGMFTSTKYAYTVSISDLDYLRLEYLELEGGFWGTIGLYGSDYIDISNCVIGDKSSYFGIYASADRYINFGTDETSEYVKIHDNVIDRGTSSYVDEWGMGYWRDQPESKGVMAINDCNYWEVYDNTITNFGHNVYIGWNSIAAGKGRSQYNKVYNNEISSPMYEYSQGIMFAADDQYPGNFEAYNEAYNNYVHHVVAGITPASDWNKIHHNIISYTAISENPNKLSDGWAIGGGGSGYLGSMGAGEGYYFNNTIYMSERFNLAHLKGLVANNLFVQWGEVYTGTEHLIYKYGDLETEMEIKNNIAFSDNKTSSDAVAWQGSPTKYYTIAELNTYTSNSGNLVSDKTSLSEIVSTSTWNLVSGSNAVDAGIDISSLISSGFTDRNGNVVDRTTPNIGAIDN